MRDTYALSTSAAAKGFLSRHHLQTLLFSSLRGYRRSWAMPDLLAGATLLVIVVPEQLATSRLAGMPPITGFYAFIAGTVLFALLGSNPQMSVGADSTIAPLFAVGIGHLAAVGSPNYVDLVGILAVTVGVLVALIGVLRLGWIAEFLSAPIITGFMAGVAIIIVIHQLPDLLGLPAVSGSNLHRFTFVATHLADTNGWTLGIGVAVFTIVIAVRLVDGRLPGALVGLISSTLIVGVFGLEAHGVAVLGALRDTGLRLGLSGLSWSALGSVAPVAGVVALVIVSQSAATTRAFANDGHHDVDVGRDFLGVGVGNIVAGLVGSFPVNASPPRTAAVASVSGRSQAAGLGASLALLLLIPEAGLLKDVPLTTLAAVLIYLATRIFHGRDLMNIARFDVFELGLAVITLLTVALVGVEQGIGVAVGLAILDRTRLTARPQLHVMGRIPGTTSWAPLSGDPEASQVPGVLAVLFATPLWYANAVHFHAQVKSSLARTIGTPQLVVLDTIGMSDLDFTGVQVLREMLDELERNHIAFGIARSGTHLRQGMSRSGLLARIGEDHFFRSVDEAVVALSSTSSGP
jgi:SulP family sulfate permease